jgi:hypothetical protein
MEINNNNNNMDKYEKKIKVEILLEYYFKKSRSIVELL